jgi:hypothetical protein
MNNRRDRRLFDSLKHFWVQNYDGCTPAEGELPQLLPHPQHANNGLGPGSAGICKTQKKPRVCSDEHKGIV